MATIDQNDLVRQAEQLNDAQWYAFLDALDEVSKRRRQRTPDVPDRPTDRSRDGVAAWIARNHLLADSSIREVWYLPTGPATEIRLLEISERTEAPGEEITPIGFGTDVDGDQRTLLVADLTSEQLEMVKNGQLRLPAGWDFSGARILGRRGE